MQHTLNRILSLLLVLVMVISMVPTVFATGETSGAATAVAENTTTGEQYADLNAAIADAQAGQIVKALADAQDVVYGNEGVILDLNGHDLSVTVAGGVTLSAIDSATDDYEGEYGSLTTDGNVATTVKTGGEVKSYVTVCENGSYSFHRYYAAIAAISLQPSKAGLGYRAEFRGDETVKNAVVGYGYELWINDNAHKTYTRTDKLEKSSLTLRLKNILAEGNDALNALGSTATIGGNAFVTLELNGERITLPGTEQETTLRQVIESINANAGSYGEAQLESVRTMITTYASWMEGWATENIFAGGEGEGDDTGLRVEITVDVTAENNILTQDATLSNDDITVTVPQGTTLEDGVTQLVLTITEKASSDSDITAEEDETLLPLDVHIEGISESNTTPILVCLGEILPKGLNIGNYALYHVENGETVEMTHVLTLDELDTHNEFHYDPATGAVTVAMASFSEVTLVANEENNWNGQIDTSWYNDTDASFEIHNADQLAGLGQLVDNGNTFKDKTITLISDIDLYGVYGENQRYNFNPIGFGYSFSGGQVFKGIFNGNGNTIYNLYQNCWDLGSDTYTYSTAGAGLFASIEDATVKNLTMDGASLVLECIDMGTVVGYANGNCTFENIIVKNSTVQNYNRYTGGVIGEVGGGGTYTFNNVDVEKTTTLSALWGTFDPSVGGIIGGVWHEAGSRFSDGRGTELSVKMVNCDVAAKLDVYNDVTSAYQWYSYRRCGMLIGYTEESKTVSGRTEATASFLTTENCTVQYGDWVNYHYCEFTNTTSMAARYPWVRVEAGLSNGAYSNARYGVPTFEGAALDVTNHTENDGCHVAGDGHDVLIVFNQLYGGGQGCYGGNSHVDQGVAVLSEDQIVLEPTPKFESAGTTTVLTGATVTLGELFQAIEGVTIQDAYVYAFVSPVNAEDSVRGTTAEPKANTKWEDLEITFSGTGTAKITISDYYYCQPTTIYVNVAAPVVRYWDYNSVSCVDCDSDGVTLPTADAEEGYTFIGWSETEIASTAEAPTVLTTGSTYLPTKAVADLYAVYSYEVAADDAKTYTLVTDASTLNVGDKLIIVSDGTSDFVAGDISDSVMGGFVNVTIQDNMINALPDKAVVLTLGGATGAWTLANDSGELLGATAVKKVAWGDGTTTWSISITNGDATIENGTSTYGRFLYNVNSPRFTTYTSNTSSSMLLPQLYKEKSSSGGEAATYYVSNSFTCEHESTTTTTVAATCTTEGLETVTCNDCRNVVSENTISVIAHNYVDGICTSCGGEKPPAYVLTDIADIREDQPVIITMKTSDGVVYTMTNDNGTTDAPGAIVATMEDGSLIPPADNIYWNIAKDGDYLIIYPNGTTDTWLYSTSDNNGTRVGTNSNKTWTIDETSGYLKHVSTSRYLGVYTTNPDWRAYTNTTGNTANQTLGFYTLECFHNNLQNVDAVTATCSAEGYTAGVQCTDCGAYTEGHETIAKLPHTEVIDEAVAATCQATGLTEGSHCSVCNTVIIAQTVTAMLDHNYVDGTCSVCGAEKPAVATMSICGSTGTLASDSSSISWTGNDGITFTNNIADSTTAIRTSDTDHYRIYAKSTVTIIAGKEIKEIKITVVDGYADEIRAALESAGYTVSVSGTVVTVTLTSSTNSITFSPTAQARITNVEVTYVP